MHTRGHNFPWKWIPHSTEEEKNTSCCSLVPNRKCIVGSWKQRWNFYGFSHRNRLREERHLRNKEYGEYQVFPESGTCSFLRFLFLSLSPLSLFWLFLLLRDWSISFYPCRTQKSQLDVDENMKIIPPKRCKISSAIYVYWEGKNYFHSQTRPGKISCAWTSFDYRYKELDWSIIDQLL